VIAMATRPNTFIVGAPKSGTTYLADWLGSSPEVFVPEVKEPGFFMDRRQYDLGPDHYIGRYYTGVRSERVVVDATPWYLYPASVPERVASNVESGDARIVISLREPVARAVSMYHDQAGRNREKRSLEEAFAEDLAVADPDTAVAAEMSEALVRHYLLCGRYAAPVRRWIDTFGSASVCVLQADEIWAEPQAVRRRLETFLGVPLPAAPARVSNPASRARLGPIETVLVRAERSRSRLRAGVAHFPTTAGRLRAGLEAVARWNQVPAPYTEIEPELAAVLRDWFAPANRELEDLTGRSLPGW
jgi:hypothetical protein